MSEEEEKSIREYEIEVLGVTMAEDNCKSERK